MNRTIFIVDGLNLYHSLADLHPRQAKWLNLRSLCSTYLSVAGQIRGEKATLEKIYYYSAIPHHRSQLKVNRHSLYMNCLRNLGVEVNLGRFKKKEVFCSRCNRTFTAHEEKESDVAIGIELFKQCHNDAFETAVLVTGDTDLNPAVKTCRELFPEKTVFFLFPYNRKNRELELIAPESVSIKPKAYFANQLPDPFVGSNGDRFIKPESW